jgi:PAS domain S-box-containing protein
MPGHATGIFDIVVLKRGSSLESQVFVVSLVVVLFGLAIVGVFWLVLRRDRICAEQIRRSEARYRLIVENQTEFVVKWRPDCTRTFVNESYCRYFGVREEECLGTSFLPLVAPEFRDLVLRKIHSLTPDHPEATDEHRSFVAGGGQRWQEWNDRGIFDAAGRLVELISTGRDVTDRKEAERKLAEASRENEEILALLDTLLAQAPVGIGIVDLDYRYIRCNDALAEMNGLPAADHIGKRVADVVPALWPKIEELYRSVLADGPVVNLELVGETAAHPQKVRVWLANCYPIRVREKTLGLGIIVSEITKLSELEAQLRQSQKMDAVGQLAGGVAHDFNNILTVINSRSDLLLADTTLDEATRNGLEAIRDAADRAAQLTRQLLAVSRQTMLEMKVLDLNHQIGEAEKMVRRLIGEDVKLAVRADVGLDRIRADSGQIHQVLLNLILNARDAMPRGGELTIETANVDSETAPSLSSTDRPGRLVRLMVGDTGCGMAPEIQSRIFEPFYTTKAPGKGTGLGLSVVHGIVQQSGGRIEVDSAPGRGSVFNVFFPAIAEDVPAAAASRSSRREELNGTETLLLVEDEDAVRTTSMMVLQTWGYNVLAAASGEEASQLLAEHAERVELLLTDVVMPGMSGRDLADALRQENPDLKVLFMSGYTSDAVLRHGILHGAANFLEKPFSPATLAKKVRDVLDRQGTD